MPPAVDPLWQTLYAAEGKPQVLGTDRIPQGKTPGEIGLSSEEASELKEMSDDQEHPHTDPSLASSSSVQPPPYEKN